MSGWFNAYVSLLALVIQALTLLVLAWTLWWLRRYTLAAEEQVEALHRPLLSIAWEPMDSSNVVLETLKAEQGKPISIGIVPRDGLSIKNIGAGPAMNIFWTLEDENTGKEILGLSGSIPRLDSNSEPFHTHIVWNNLINHECCRFAARYETLRGVKYETKVQIARRETINYGWQFVVTTTQTARM